ncbi:MAG: hypothetical protein RBS01_03410 [Candidatus Dojkabacteria bacterium]|jgi:hypothetical protein|nr:hypothetical protein [Candidatus Dojkabacteria bacterium]
MKNIKVYNKKNVLAVIAGILATGLILNTVNEIALTQIEGIENAKFQKEFEEDVEYIQNNPVQETILENSASISPEDALKAKKIENIRKYLSKRGAPLAANAKDFVEAADMYGIDYRLVAAISIIESSGGLHNFKPYNAWGWGSYSFKNFKEGIYTVSKGLGGYYSRGLDTPKEISVYYCPPSASAWASKVTYVMNLIGE